MREIEFDIEEECLDEIKYTVVTTWSKTFDKVYGSLNITDFPACCGACIFNSATVKNSTEPQAILEALLTKAVKYAKSKEFGVAFYIATDKQPTLLKALESQGWQLVLASSNPKTGNKLYTYTMNLTGEDN